MAYTARLSKNRIGRLACVTGLVVAVAIGIFYKLRTSKDVGNSVEKQFNRNFKKDETVDPKHETVDKKEETVDPKESVAPKKIDRKAEEIKNDLKSTRLAELCMNCAEGLSHLNYVTPNGYKVDEKTLKDFRKSALQWKTGANLEAHQGCGELQRWISQNPANEGLAAALEAEYYRTEFIELLENEYTRNLMIDYLQDKLSVPEEYLKPAYEGAEQDVEAFLAERFGRRWRTPPPLEWWVRMLREYVTNPSAVEILSREPPIPEGMSRLAASYQREEVRSNIIERFSR